MSSITAGEDTPFNSTASAIQPPRAYFSALTSDPISKFLDNPLGTWQSTILLVISLVALGTCAIFLAIRYAEILRLNVHREYSKIPLSLEGQQPKRLVNRGKAEIDPFEETPTTQFPFSQDKDRSEMRRRLGGRYVQPNKIAVREVQEGKIAQRRASSSKSARRNTQAQDQMVAMPRPT